MSGLICSRLLVQADFRVTLVDKARGPGGRMSTRRIEGTAFDHGAQYFTARDARFVEQVEGWIADGIVREWAGRLAAIYADGISNLKGENSRYVGVPRMSAITRHLATGLDLTTGWHAESLQQDHKKWRLRGQNGEELGPFEAAVAAVPSAQAAPLLQPAPALAERARSAGMASCYAVMLAFEQPLPLPFDAAFVNVGPLSWIARNSSKPGRVGPETWVLHAGPEWSDAHIEESPERVAKLLTEALIEVTQANLPEPDLAVAHRWRYALPLSPLADRCLFEPELGLGACGDWCAGPRVEGAYLSGSAMAERLIQWAGMLPSGAAP